MKDFLEFIRTQSVLGLAVGFILGGSVQNVVSSLVTNVVNPIIGVFIGPAESLRALTIPFFGNSVLIGEFLLVLLDFLVIAFIVYFLVKKLGIINADLASDKK